MTPILFAVGVVFLAQLSPSNVAATEPVRGPLEIAANEAAPTVAGEPTSVGRCGGYKAIEGSAKIVRVEETAASSAQATSNGGPGYAGYEVRFSFTPDAPVSDAETDAWIMEDHELRLANSWYPGPVFIEKYGLETGRTIPAVLEVQEPGPCTPFVVRFPTVDTTDYFESAK